MRLSALQRQRAALLCLVTALVWTAWLHFTTWVGLGNGLIDRGILELLQHESPPFGSWSGRVHPPLYSVVLWAADSLAGPWGMAPERVLFLQGAFSHVAAVAVIGLAAWRWLGPWPAVGAAWLLAFGTESMRPFEHYPISALAATVAGVALLGLARAGGRWATAATALAGFVMLWLHLSPWFLFGPFLVALAWLLPERRRALIGAAVAVFVAFMATTYPGFYRQLLDGGGLGGERGSWTFGWMNGWLYLPLLLWARVREPDQRIWGSLAIGLVGYALATFGLQLGQLADGQPYPSSLHYFALVEPLVVLGGVAGLTAAVRSGGRPRQIAGVMALVVVATQVARWLDSMTWLWRQQTGMWTQAIQPWNWL